MESQSTTPSVKQLRLVVETDDFDAAVEFYRDALGLEEEFFVDSGEGAVVLALRVGRATLEIVSPEQRLLIDNLEVGHDVSPRIRVAFEVDDAAEMTNRLVEAGANLIAAPTGTPWGSLNSRLDAPMDLQITLFQELKD